MKANFNRPFTDVFGAPVLSKAGQPEMINRHLGFILFNIGDDNHPLNAQEKFLAYTLSMKIANAPGEIEISQEEADFIDRVASQAYAAGAYGNIKSIITNP